MALAVASAVTVAVKVKHRRNRQHLVKISKDQAMEIRTRHCSKALSVSYQNTGPLMIVKGRKCHLFDENGVAYLDTRNNVAHCGHSHPNIVRAVQSQMTLLNTNTRYLHPHMVQLVDRLVGGNSSTKTRSGFSQKTPLLPSPLEIVVFCNSGSEANDLALRLARAYADGSTNTIVVDRAYHGHTLATLEVSPYKYECGTERYQQEQSFDNNQTKNPHHPGSHIYKVPCPDVYRGPYRDPATAGALYASHVEEACNYYQNKGERVRAMIIEGGMSVAGVIVPPPGYLAKSIRAVRKAGGVYIADEVQTGFGRLGTTYWAFQQQQEQSDEKEPVIPDIVTVGKPFGNGMPLAAVITTREIAATFENCGVEYFNTFAGNPVACAAGLAVLDTMEEENLQENAIKVGSYLIESFREMMDRVELIGDIRGSGLFVGIELVRDRATLEPASEETSFICSILKSKYHILTSIDGVHDNVIVVKPPMVFSKKDVDMFAEAFERAVLVDLPMAGEISSLAKTPT